MRWLWAAMSGAEARNECVRDAELIDCFRCDSGMAQYRSRPESYTMKGEIEPMIKPVIEPNFWFNPNV